MAGVTPSSSARKKKSAWQLFTNDGRFDSKLPPSQRLHRPKSVKLFLIPVPSAKPRTFEPEKAQPKVEYLENFIIVWLDQSPSNLKDDQTSLKHLKQVANCVKVFIDPERCQTFINAIKNEKVLVILSGKVEEQFVSSIHEEKQLESFYIFSPGKRTEQAWFEQYPEIRGVYTSIVALCEQLGKDIRMLDYNLIGFEIMERSTSKSSQQEAMFMYDQLFRDIILTIPDEDMADMIEYCEKQYRDSFEDQQFLQMFKKSYPSRSPIYWYTCEAFLYRILNKALRTHEYDMLYFLRVFIRHLHERVAVTQTGNGTERVDLFRGQAMDKDDFERLQKNEGGLLCFSSFLSTSANRDVGLAFAQKALEDKRKVSILFEIKVNKKTAIPVAGVTDQSYYKTEQEWLFSMGSVFRIGRLKCLPEGIWIVPLTLTDDKDEQLNALREHLKKSMADRDVCRNFASLMYKIGKWEKSEFFYAKALETEKTPQRRSLLFNDIGMVKSKLKQYDTALSYYKESLAFDEAQQSKDISGSAPTYNNIATLYHSQRKMDRAMEYYKKAIDASNTKEKPNEDLIATLNSNMSTIYSDQGKYAEALEKCEEALRIRVKIFPAIHPDIASSYGTMAYILCDMGSYEKAVEYIQKAIQIDRQALPPDHPQLRLHERNFEVFKQREKQNSK